MARHRFLPQYDYADGREHWAGREYYAVWQYLAEMPGDAMEDPKYWLHAMQVVYRPGVPREQHQSYEEYYCQQARSTEMIYRGWDRLDYLAQRVTLAKEIQNAFLGEFEQRFLNAPPSSEEYRIARTLKDHFIEIPAGSFEMGSELDRRGQGVRHWLIFTRMVRSNDETVVEQALKPVFDNSEKRQRIGFQRLESFLGWVRNEGTRSFREWLESPPARSQEIDGFCLHRDPCVNELYQLFDPGFGQKEGACAGYRVFSPEDNCALVGATWYDAWACTKFAYWDNLSCHLPEEHEWEYAARAPWIVNILWGNLTKWMHQYLHIGKREGDRGYRALIPDDKRANPAGLRDIVGNVNEWCASVFERRRVFRTRFRTEYVFRCLRGGSFVGIDVRCSLRHGLLPADRDGTAAGFVLPGLEHPTLNLSSFPHFFATKSRAKNLRNLPTASCRSNPAMRGLCRKCSSPRPAS